MREPSWSLVPVAKCGLSSVAPCHHSVFSAAPPPPRLVGRERRRLCRADPAGREHLPGQRRREAEPQAMDLCTNARRESSPRLHAPR